MISLLHTPWGYIIASNCFVIINIIVILSRKEVHDFQFVALISKTGPSLPAVSVGYLTDSKELIVDNLKEKFISRLM